MDYDWRTLGNGGQPVRLFYQAREVARLCQRLDGSYYAALNQHLPFTEPERRDVPCTGYESGKAGLETWLLRHQKRIDGEMVSWLAARGKDRA